MDGNPELIRTLIGRRIASPETSPGHGGADSQDAHILECVRIERDGYNPKLMDMVFMAAMENECETVLLMVVCEIKGLIGEDGFKAMITAEGFCPLHRAASKSLHGLRILLEHGADVMTVDEGEDGETVLASAVYSGSVEVCRIVIDAIKEVGGDISAGDENGQRHYISHVNGNVRRLRNFCFKRVPVSSSWETGEFLECLKDAVCHNVPASAGIIVDLTCPRRVPLDLSKSVDQDSSSLPAILEHNLTEASSGVSMRIMKLLIKASPDGESQNDRITNETLLPHVLKRLSRRKEADPSLYLPIIDLLVSSTNDVTSIIDNEGNMPLHVASSEGTLAAIDYILARLGEDKDSISIRNREGSTALHAASYRGDLAATERILASLGQDKIAYP
ncbi:hypothetical protein AJ79_09081 [Helicocarpus griseus UAMH5409]|uniref:Uncharacterized protein n=1 Tax=Helicocarpus griseus UAMH5409 TaxID=1447875 RepID=A0A2B7WEC0_9EURO|nr:hypothetical protein AJ79_09081 [Helicocarpus griseus UAMH5409]